MSSGVYPNAIFYQDKDPLKSVIVADQIPLPLFNCVAIEGGGVRGAAYAGCFYILEKYGLLKNVKHVSGASVGAITALFLALGFTVDECYKELYSMPMDKFLEGSQSWSWTPDILATARKVISIATNQHLSLSDGVEFYNWIAAQVEKKLGKKGATFRDLHNYILKETANGGTTRLKNLYVAATDITLELPERKFFSYESTPDMPIALAIRASSSYPGVFKAVEWDGHKYADGGIMDNLPAKFFDKKEFVPEGYTLNELGHNPGVLSLKIDSRREIEQVLWGVQHTVSVQTKTEIGGQIYNAAVESVDTDMVRSRPTIALPDGDISSLNFTIDEKGKVNLISTAEKTTQEYLENLVKASYGATIYKSEQEWLENQSIDNLARIIKSYEDQRQEILKKNTAPVVVNLSFTLPFDPYNPSLTDITEHLQFLYYYLNYRVAKIINPSVALDRPYPVKHINIKPVRSQDRWDVNLEKEMEARLEVVSKHLVLVEEQIKQSVSDFEENIESSEIKQKLHDNLYFDDIALVTGMYEYSKLLREEKSDLELKLGKVKKEEAVEVKEIKPQAELNSNNHPLVMKQNQTVSKPSTFDPNYYHLFAIKMQEAQNRHDLSAPLRAVIQYFDQFHPELVFRSSNEAHNVLFTLNLLNEYDTKIFLIAGMLYLQSKKEKEVPDMRIFKQIYGPYFVKFPEPPKNMYDLSKILNQQGTDLLVSAYRIEELMHFFTRTENSKQGPTIDIDHLFGASAKSFFATSKEKSKKTKSENSFEGVAMQSIFKPSTNHLRLEETQMKVVPSRDMIMRGQVNESLAFNNKN